MPYQVQQIIEGNGIPVCVTKDEPVTKALSIMIEHDFSQLPVVSKKADPAIGEIVLADGMVTYEGILRGIRNFKARIEDLKVRDVMVSAPIYSIEDELFDILDRMKDTNAVLVTEDIGTGSNLVGIVTSYDTAEYFRKRTEDSMRVEDIELMIRDFIKEAYLLEDGNVDHTKLDAVIAKHTKPISTSDGRRGKSFDQLSLYEYITILTLEDTWEFFNEIFGVQRSFVIELLQGIREIRNSLAHFRDNVSAEQRDKLKFGTEWLTRRQEEYQAIKEEQVKQKIVKQYENWASEATEALEKYTPANLHEPTSSTDFAVTEAATGGGRYAVLADWLQSRPGRVDTMPLTFNEIEEIIGIDLPASARNHRAWWANDSVGHSHSQLWLEAGWRTTYINLTEGKITFSRIRERERAYIEFFSKLLGELRKKADFPLRDASPDGASWIVVQTVPQAGNVAGQFSFSFSRDRRLRVELYLDMGDRGPTKNVFDRVHSQNTQLEAQLGQIEWERLENRRASRIALYHEGHILEEKGHTELIKWASDSMVKFYHALASLAEEAILDERKKWQSA